LSRWTTRQVSPSTIEVVKALVRELAGGGAPEQQCLEFAGAKLDDARTLAECGVPDGATLVLTLRSGGDAAPSAAPSRPTGPPPPPATP
jgi:hypothetical protein